MPSLEPILDRVVPVLLVAFRLAGLFLLAPLLSSPTFPARVKAILLFMLGFALYPMVADAPSLVRLPEIDLAMLLPLIVRESLIGLSIGAIAAIPLLSMEAAGALIGQQVGFGLAKVYNPEMDTDADLVGQLLFYLAMAAFLAAGGLESLFICAAETFRHVAVGGFGAEQLPLDVLIGVVSGGCELALRVSAPIVGVVTLLLCVFGFLTKTMPQINILSVGFSAKILGGLAMLVLSIGTSNVAIGDEVGRVLRIIAARSFAG